MLFPGATGNFKADEIMVGARCVVAFGHLVHIEGKFHSCVHGGIILIGYYGAIFLGQLGYMSATEVLVASG